MYLLTIRVPNTNKMAVASLGEQNVTLQLELCCRFLPSLLATLVLFVLERFPKVDISVPIHSTRFSIWGLLYFRVLFKVLKFIQLLIKAILK